MNRCIEQIGSKKHQQKEKQMKPTSKHKTKIGLWAAFVMAAFVSSKAPAYASTNTVHLDIHVSINASKSLALGTTSYNFGALSVNTSSVSASAIVVTNDSTALQETYT